MAKRTFDLVASLCALIILCPVFVLVALAIKIDSPGPVFYRGVRAGRFGRAFRIWKFRTMVHGAEESGITATSRDDRRVTAVGRVLRKPKLDELPQLINVVLGEMSLVGPRPDVPRYAAMLRGQERRILDLRPGLTDYASIWNLDQGAVLAGSDDPERDYRERIRPLKLRHQLRYLEERSFRVDVKILVLTLVGLARLALGHQPAAVRELARPRAGAPLEAPRPQGLPRRFLRDVTVLVGGVAVSQVLVLASVPLLTRLYTPEQIGLFGVLLAGALVVSPFACGRYEQAIVLGRDEAEAVALLWLSLAITLGVSLVLLVALAGWAGPILGLVGIEATDWWPLVPLVVLAGGTAGAFRGWATRRGRFGAVALSRTARSGGMVGVQVGAALAAGASAAVIAAGLVAGLVAEAVVLASQATAVAREAVSPRALWRAAVRYRRFPLYLMPGGIAVAAGSFGLPIFVGVLFGATAAGYFFIAERVLSAPVTLVSQSVGTVLYQRLSLAQRSSDEDAPAWLATVAMGMLLAAAMPAAVLVVLAPWAFEALLGPGWDEAGRYAQAGAVRAAVGFAAFPMCHAFLVYGRQDHLSAWQAAVAVAQVGGLFTGAALGGPLAAAWGYSIASAVVLATAYVLPLRYAGIAWRQQPRCLWLGASSALRAVLPSRPRAATGASA